MDRGARLCANDDLVASQASNYVAACPSRTFRSRNELVTTKTEQFVF